MIERKGSCLISDGRRALWRPGLGVNTRPIVPVNDVLCLGQKYRYLCWKCRKRVLKEVISPRPLDGALRVLLPISSVWRYSYAVLVYHSQ